MGAKKKGGKKKGKGGKGKNIDDLTTDEMNHVLERQREALIDRLINETDVADKSKSKENEIRHEEMKLEKMVMDEKQTQMDIIADMTRQFKSVE